MRVVRDMSLVHPTADAHITVGVFDGVHCGHQRLVSGMAAAAHASGRLAIAYTFDPHPLAVLGKEPPPFLTTMEERAALMATLDLDVLVVPKFTTDTAHTTAADFTAALVRYLRMVELWAGLDFALGYQREGDIAALRLLGAEQGFTVRVVPPLICEGTRVSSSRVRDALAVGDVGWAAQCLGRPYRLSGVAGPHAPVACAIPAQAVVISPARRRMVPAAGVYACRVTIGLRHAGPAVAYVGADGDGGEEGSALEAYLVDFTDTVRGQTVSLDFVARLRDLGGPGSQDRLPANVLQDIALTRTLVVVQPPRTTGWHLNYRSPSISNE
jgi:riboflavin kinase/FMN adenylyltransferase